MSDSGTFTCLQESGAQPPIRLEVTGGEARPPASTGATGGSPTRVPPCSPQRLLLTPICPPGCRNNLTVSSNWTSPSTLTLHCRRCPPLAGPASFRWFLNSQPLGNRRWATKSQLGATVRLDPSRRAAWGRWECRLLGASSGAFEFCVEPPLGAGSTGPGSEWGIWVAVAVLGLIGAGLGACCLWRWRRGRNRWNQNKRENKTGAPGPRLSPLEEPRLGAKSTERRLVPQSQERKVPGTLLYAEVQHPLVTPAPPPPPDGATVYATIV
ncbi:putative serine/threonine-protein kinase pknG [Platysternon megacephalum]|uniref:Putative serine/threonine-protein kinase pknG n=1 Tax=Platysternon megacephalum TaxID=55544 RepID=A0A4D9DF88_9SAUR|nr:putative serine/threonine-protein kinase pknG [Platysternon megacephalum]